MLHTSENYLLTPFLKLQFTTFFSAKCASTAIRCNYSLYKKSLDSFNFSSLRSNTSEVAALTLAKSRKPSTHESSYSLA